MGTLLRILPRFTILKLRANRQPAISRAAFSSTLRPNSDSTTRTRGPPSAPAAETAALREGSAPTYLGTTKRLPEFNLVDKVVLVSGAARGLGLVQAEALLEAGAIGMLLVFLFSLSHRRGSEV